MTKKTEIVQDGKRYLVVDTPTEKVCAGVDYKSSFRKKDGFFFRFGKTKEDDPQFSPIGNEIADIEITTSCAGIPNKAGVKSPCAFCYKANTIHGTYMPLAVFKQVFANLPAATNQIAFGVDAECKTNPEWFDIFKYTREQGVIPNVTVANIDDETADKLVSVCGAVAVSRYSNKDVCYDTVKRLTDRGLKQTNIHILVSEETYDDILESFNDIKTDSRLKGLNAIVLLSLKKKGRGVSFNSISQEKFEHLIRVAFSNNIRVGFDSCSCHKFLNSITSLPKSVQEQLTKLAEPCESTCFSIYVNVEGYVFPCSFCEESSAFAGKIDLKKPVDFIKDVWYNDDIKGFRKTLLKNERNCPIYQV